MGILSRDNHSTHTPYVVGIMQGKQLYDKGRARKGESKPSTGRGGSCNEDHVAQRDRICVFDF